MCVLASCCTPKPSQAKPVVSFFRSLRPKYLYFFSLRPPLLRSRPPLLLCRSRAFFLYLCFSPRGRFFAFFLFSWVLRVLILCSCCAPQAKPSQACGFSLHNNRGGR